MRLRIDLRQLECFVAVAEEGSFRAAAERLHMSQPPLSRQIKQLEAMLGVTLLSRDARGATLTAAGRAFLKGARSTLLQAGEAVDTARRHAGHGPRPLRVGCTTFFDPEIFPALEPAYQKLVPNGSLIPFHALSVELIQRLRRGSLDVALIGLPSETRELVVEPLYSEPMVAVLPAKHPLARYKILSFAQIKDEPLFWPQRRVNPGLFDYYEEIFRKLGYAPSQRLPAPMNHLLVLSRVAKEEGIGLIPKSMMKIRRTGTTFRPLREKEFWIGYGIAYKDGPQTPEREALLSVLRRKTEKYVPAGEVRLNPTVAPYTEPAVRRGQSKGRQTAGGIAAKAHGRLAERRSPRPASG